MEKKPKKTRLDVGKIYAHKSGGSQIHIPKRMAELLPYAHSETLKLSLSKKRLVIEPLGGGG